MESKVKGNIGGKIRAFFVSAYTGKWRFLSIGITAIILLYVLYFAFIYKRQPWSGGKDVYWQDARIIAFHVIMGVALAGLLALGVVYFAKGKLTLRKAAVIIAIMAAIFISIYGLSTPIFDCGVEWNQHDLYYGSISSRYTMEDGVTDGGGGHFGLIMTIFRYNRYPEIIKNEQGVYDFDFSAVLERYQPKTFYFLSAYFMRFNSLFIHAGDDIVTISGSKLYGLTNNEWALFESLRIMLTAIQIAQLYFVYKIFVRLHMHGKGLLIAFALVGFNPMWCFFANWANNDGISACLAIIGLYYAICYLQDKKTYQAALSAAGVGLSMSCKLGGALIAIVIAPMLIFGFIRAIKESKDAPKGQLPPWGKSLLQLGLFAIIVFPLGLGWPLYNYFRFGQEILFFSPVNNSSLHIVNDSFFERFILFPNYDNFKFIWVYHSNRDAASGFIQDTSLPTALMKTSLYGEYGFGLSTIQCLLLYHSSFALILAMMIAWPYRFIRFLLSKNKVVDPLRIFVFAAIIVVFYGWAVYFVNSNPDTCNEDMRYIAPIILALSGLVGTTFTYFEEHETVPLVSNIGKVTIITLATIFSIMACITYLTISPWYVRL